MCPLSTQREYYCECFMSQQMRHVIKSVLETVDGETEATEYPSTLVDHAKPLMEKVTLLTVPLQKPVSCLYLKLLFPLK